ncbi:MAG: SURF1 family protein, partial [Caulobacteraceae bacterium]|nr:SURF1 family protein [Caulobacteraceae bacterium]
TVTRDSDQYRHVTLRGRFDNDRETLTQAVTDYGPGFWVMTPFRTDAGFTVLVNRGYVPSDRRAPDTRAAGQISGETTVQGLLRITEPKGGFLRANDPATDSWRSRDVAAIAAKRGLIDVAPYFVDADATANAGGWPKGGLTVIRFPNSHLVYALTWFGLALMLTAGGAFLAWDERRVRRAFAGEV